MNAGGGVLKTLIAGGVMIGMATAILLPGRPTVDVIKAGGNAAQGFLGTAITGKA